MDDLHSFPDHCGARAGSGIPAPILAGCDIGTQDCMASMVLAAANPTHTSSYFVSLCGHSIAPNRLKNLEELFKCVQ
jgi:hypothetical protein